MSSPRAEFDLSNSPYRVPLSVSVSISDLVSSFGFFSTEALEKIENHIHMLLLERDKSWEPYSDSFKPSNSE